MSAEVWVCDLEATMLNDQPHELRDQFEPEIIQLGVCKVGVERMEPMGVLEFFIKPQRTVYGEFCQKLTGIDPKQLEQGLTFNVVCDTIASWISPGERRKPIWASWGDWDRTMMKRACEMTGAVHPFSWKHQNIKRLHWYLEKRCRGGESGLGRALKQSGMSFEGAQHTAGDDAYNAARIMCMLVNKYGEAADGSQ